MGKQKKIPIHKQLIHQNISFLRSNPIALAAIVFVTIILGYLGFSTFASGRDAATWNSLAPGIRQCESGGNYAINTGNGYYGAYQFNKATWDGQNTGFAYANQAPKAVQDAAAFRLYQQRGLQPWTCGATAQAHPCLSNCGDSTGGAVAAAPINYGANQPYGLIGDHWKVLGAAGGFLGAPIEPEAGNSCGGRYQRFQGGQIIWRADTGAWSIHGDIRLKANTFGVECGWLGYPLSDETITPDHRGHFNRFQNAYIYWTPQTGAHSVNGSILNKWSATGWETNLGYPVTDELSNSCGGKYSIFDNKFGSSVTSAIIFSNATGAVITKGDIRAAYVNNYGGECGRLGYPTGDEYSSNGYQKQNFQRGTLVWNPSNRQVTQGN